jgi:hypothetical protein
MNKDNFSRDGAKTRRVESSRHTRAGGYPGSQKINIQQAAGQLAGRFYSQLVQGAPALFPGFQRGGQS